MKAVTEWQEGFKSVVDNGRGQSIVIDVPETKGGTNAGPTALDLAVMGLSGCIGTIFAMIAKNSKIEFSSLRVDVDADKPDSAATIASASAVVTIETEEPKDKLERILAKTMKLCPVGVLFEQAGIEVKHELIIL